MWTSMQFIEQVILKSGEKVDRITEEGQLQRLLIVKQTARTYRKMAELIIGETMTDKQIPEQLLKYKFTPKAKRIIDEEQEVIYHWLVEGWIIREIRFHVDGISVCEDSYRMGPMYFYAIEKQKAAVTLQYETELTQLLEVISHSNYPVEFQQAARLEHMPQQWSKQKKLKFLHFTIAFYQLADKQDLFDFKEIGANYEDRIGGSKIFDVEREDFLRYFEQSGIDIAMYGLVSMGKVVPILFTGDLHSPLATYQLGAVHSTTDDAVLKTIFQTNSKILWLVENRAILTRMAVEREFLQETNSFVLCVDGQIRSAHKQLIHQLLDSSIEKVLIWGDYDDAGTVIIKHAIDLLSKPFTIIGRDGQTFTSFEEYKQSLYGLNMHEQEQQLGGVAQWRKWM